MVWYPQRAECHKTIALKAANRIHEMEHEEQPYHDGTFTTWSDKATPQTPNHFRDGVLIWVADEDLSPGADVYAVG